MNPCDHKPLVGFKTVFQRSPKLICRHCGEKIKMTKPFQNVTRVIYGILVVAMLLVALNGKSTEAGTFNWTLMAVNISVMLGIMALYLVIQMLFFRFAKYELAPPSEVQEQVEDKSSASEVANPEHTQEQLEIMERYAAMERQALMDEGLDPDAAGAAKVVEELPVTDCVHIPSKSWKNYIPTKFDFVCDQCGKPIVFAPAVKKRVNVLIMLVTFLILMPSAFSLSVVFWKFVLLTLLVLAIGTTIQIYFVKQGPFILKDSNEQKK